MFGSFITRGLVLAFGYAYPAFECFKTVEKNRVEIEELRFWCQYWIIAAVITVFERVGDIFISWIPMYGEAKLVLFIYLWYPKTKGCGFIYESLVRPYVSKHETDIDRSLQELRARAMDLVIYYWQNCAKMGQTKFLEVLQFLASHSANVIRPKPEKAEVLPSDGGALPSPPPPSSPCTPTVHFKRNKQVLVKGGRPPMPPPSPTCRRVVAQSPRARSFEAQLDSRTGSVLSEDARTTLDEDSEPTIKDVVAQHGVDHILHAARLKLRRSKASLNQQ